jgi:serine/threonine protein kinase
MVETVDPMNSIGYAVASYREKSGAIGLVVGSPYSSGKRGVVVPVQNPYGRSLVAKCPRTGSPTCLLDFKQEHRVLRHVARVDTSSTSPRVVHFEPAVAGRLPVMLMERIEGAPLREWASLARRARLLLNPKDVSRFARLLVRAMKPVFTAGWIHGDLSPNNVFVQRSDESDIGKILLVDFGSARRINELYGERIFTTPNYHSPLVTAEGPAEVAHDFFSAACLLHFALVGAPPVLGKNGALSVSKILNPRTKRIVIGLSQGDCTEFDDSGA